MVDESPKQQAFKTGIEMLQQVQQDAADDGKHDFVLDAYRAMQNRPGVKTTEFYFALVLNAIGGAMQFWAGHETHGIVLMAVGSIAYTASRTVVKLKS